MTTTLTRGHGFPPPGSTAGWNGRAVANARTWLATQTTWPTPCQRCGHPVTPHAWHLGHRLSRQDHPELTWHTDNWRIEHIRCSTSAGATQGNKRRNKTTKITTTPTKVISFSDRRSAGPAAAQNSLQLSTTSGGWLPDLPTPPTIETDIGPNVAGSYGADFVAWCARNLGEAPRPWQAYVAARVLEHDADGELLHRRVGISVPRQVGKSVLLRMLAAWRMHQDERFGERQTVLHVAHALNTTEEVFVPALEWAKRYGLKVREANGQMRIETASGSRWLPRSTQTGYGFTLSMALVDEAWAVAPRRVNSGYAPTLSERRSGQVVMFSSANEEATSLFPKFREAASRPGWLLLEWSAPDGADPADPAVWAAATPVEIDGVRRSLMADELAADPRTFRFERLNMWPVLAGMSWGERLRVVLPVPSVPVWGGPLTGGLESEPDGSGWGAAVSDGSHVDCMQLATLAEALGWLRGWGPVRVLTHESVGKQLTGVDDLELGKVSVSDARAATAVLRDSAAGLSWSGVLAEQLGVAGVSNAGQGEALDAGRSAGAVSGVKAAAWALWGARTAAVEIPMIY